MMTPSPIHPSYLSRVEFGFDSPSRTGLEMWEAECIEDARY